MRLKIIASLPGKSLENKFDMCSDGRGGWTLSQVNVDRVIADYADYYLVFCFGVLVENAIPNDFVESTHLSASMNGKEVGTSVRDWIQPNAMWNEFDGNAIFEWAQAIEMQPRSDGVITIGVSAKLHSQSHRILVEGSGYCRIKKVDFDLNLPPRRWESPLMFNLKELLPKRWRRRKAWSTVKNGAG